MSGKHRRLDLLLLAAAWLVIAAGAASAQDLNSSIGFNWSTMVNPAEPGYYLVRGLAVNQTSGDIYVARCASNADQGVPSKIDKLGANGTILWSKGPDLKDASNATRATIRAHGLTGIAVDPLTGNLHVILYNTDFTSTVHVLDSSGVWLKSFPTGMPACDVAPGSAFGGAFSDDGQKYLIAGMLEKLPGPATDAVTLGDARGSSYGGKLFVRNDNGTPADPSDDTWTAAVELTDNGEFFTGFAEPRGTAFDRQGRPYVAEGLEHSTPNGNFWCNAYVRSYDAAAPYEMSRCLVTGSAWGLDTDSAGNLWCAYGRDRDSGSPRRVRCVNPEGVRLFGFVPSGKGGVIADPTFCACDRSRGRVIVAGSDVVGGAGQYTYVESFTPALQTPNTITFTGRVTDKATGQGIPNANVGFRSTAGNDFPANAAIWAHGYWERGRADANGYYSLTKNVLYGAQDPPQSFPIVPVASAAGHLSKRTYAYQIGPGGGDEKLVLPDIALDGADKDTLYIRLYGKEGLFDPQEEESGLFWVFRGSGNLSWMELERETVIRLGNLYSGLQGWYNRHLHLLVDDRWMKAASPFQTLWVTVEYYAFVYDLPDGELGTWDTVGVEADVIGSGYADQNQMVGTAYKTSEFAWKTTTFPVSNAYFGNRGLKGSDLRINSIPPPGNAYIDGYSMDWIRSVTISKTPPEEGYPAYPTIAAAKQAGTGFAVLENKVITGAWNGQKFYLQEPDRTAGIRVDLMPPWIETDLIQRTGRYGHAFGRLMKDYYTGEPYILATSYGAESSGPADPLGMRGDIAGAKTSAIDISALKVGVWGTVASVSYGDSFVLNDGSSNVKVLIDPSITINWPTAGDYVSVVGITTLDGYSPATAQRVIKPWLSEGVLIVNDLP